MLIAEQLLLLCLDPVPGTFRPPHSTRSISQLLAAGLLLDLAEQQRVTGRDALVIVSNALPVNHAVLDSALRVLSRRRRTRTIDWWLGKLRFSLRPLPTRLLDGLHRRDILHREWHFRGGFWPVRRYPMRSRPALHEAQALLQHAGMDSESYRLRELGLLLLTDCAGLLDAHLNATAAATARQRLAGLTSWAQVKGGLPLGILELFGALREALQQR